MKKTFQTITRKGSFDSGHRVMNEKMKCFNLHGHTYLFELTFSFNSMESIGYAIDFKEIKRVACQWIDDILDHGVIVNPHDQSVIRCAEETGSKIWFMNLNGNKQYCNPTVENIAKEVFLAMEILFQQYTELKIHKVKIHETPNCSTVCKLKSITDTERLNFYSSVAEIITEYAEDKGIINYDDRNALY
jgi:6-pyruvoyltetrahydropterin/6-carboxytetrahydropterin synthase